MPGVEQQRATAFTFTGATGKKTDCRDLGLQEATMSAARLFTNKYVVSNHDQRSPEITH